MHPKPPSAASASVGNDASDSSGTTSPTTRAVTVPPISAFDVPADVATFCVQIAPYAGDLAALGTEVNRPFATAMRAVNPTSEISDAWKDMLKYLAAIDHLDPSDSSDDGTLIDEYAKHSAKLQQVITYVT
ncbi:MAG: hypothetical protein QOF63_4283, partial [Thermoanaerobaculia bacterium]|nr:hypothetical protein [Thermoanaerobaculia bacterium]